MMPSVGLSASSSSSATSSTGPIQFGDVNVGSTSPMTWLILAGAVIALYWLFTKGK